jgi:CRISPR-associated protein Csm2
MSYDRGGGRSGYSGGRGERRGESPAEIWSAVWPDYLKRGYFDADGNLRPEYVGRDKAESLAEKIAAAGVTRTQIRRYFSHCKALETRLLAVPESERGARLGQLTADFQVLDSAAAYAMSKGAANLPGFFADFIRRNIAAVRNHKDFTDGFVPHFEAVVGFGWAHYRSGQS